MKPGIKTTEFWLVLFIALLPITQQVLTGAMDWQVGLGSAATVLAYAFTRGSVKSK